MCACYAFVDSLVADRNAMAVSRLLGAMAACVILFSIIRCIWMDAGAMWMACGAAAPQVRTKHAHTGLAGARRMQVLCECSLTVKSNATSTPPGAGFIVCVVCAWANNSKSNY